ncbi:MAG TPA: DUF5995 family protein [Thermoleophilaceae bacterium]|jgi:hypothetical protein
MESIQPVIDRMEAIGGGLPETDGVARFNAMYLAVTREVAKQAQAGVFQDPAALSLLDVVFADLYFDAVDASTSGKRIPRAWRPLFEAREKKRVHPLQFAFAGMNAHINHDLVVAIVDTCKRNDTKVERNSPFHTDYLAVNKLLAKVEDSVKRQFLTGALQVADEAAGRLDDVIAMWSIEAARDGAWNHAEALSHLPDFARKPYLDALAGTVGLAGRGLLVPVL